MACTLVVIVLLLLLNLQQARLEKSTFQFSATEDNSNFRTLYNLSIKDCRSECSTRPACVSINYFRLARSCDLNKMLSGSREVSGEVERRAGYVHSKRSDWMDNINLSCGCDSGQKCIAANNSCVFAECEKPAVFTRANMLAPGARSDSGVRCMRDLATVQSFGAGLDHATFPYIQTCGSDGRWKFTTPPSGQCHMVAFTLVPGTNTDPYVEWKDGNASPNEPSRTMPYRSHVIDTWDNLPITHVRLSIYINHQEVKYVLFNGTGSSNMDWFSASRVMDSSWQDLATIAAITDDTRRGYYFSLVGHVTANSERRFFINWSYGGCSVDTGWFVVVTKGRCNWATRNEVYPKFLYSSLDVAGVWNTDSETADYVYVVPCIGNC